MMVDLRRPPAWRFTGPIIDAHCHLGNMAATGRMLRAGRLYGVRRWMGICAVEQVSAMRRRFGDQLGFSIWTDHKPVGSRRRFIDRNLRIVNLAARRKCHCLKFWYKPEFNQRTGMFFDDPRLDPVFRSIVDADLPVLVHIADPDVWWQHRYRDRELFETKQATYRQLTNTLERFPELRVLAAHMGGWPENLPFLADLLARYRRLSLDTSGTKWIVRELSRRRDAARAFVIRHADRLLFGSDLVPFPRSTLQHHCSRYWAHRHLYEGTGSVRSPIEDPDAGRPVSIVGLNLPDRVLNKLYYANALRFFGLESET